jgi:hypothetical protein
VQDSLKRIHLVWEDEQKGRRGVVEGGFQKDGSRELQEDYMEPTDVEHGSQH